MANEAHIDNGALLLERRTTDGGSQWEQQTLRGRPRGAAPSATAVGTATKALSDIKICRISLTHPKPRQRTMNALLKGLRVREGELDNDEASTLVSQHVNEKVRQEALFRLMTCLSKY